MAIVDLFHKRQKRLRGDYPDVYQYEKLPDRLKVQIVHLWKETIGEDYSGGDWNPSSSNREHLKKSYKILCKELGVFKLNEEDIDNENYVIYLEDISNYFINEIRKNVFAER